MRVFILDTEGGMGLDFAVRCVEYGHEVRLFNETKHPIGKGFDGIKITDDWRSSVAWAKDGLIVPTGNSKYTIELDRFREFGARIFGPTHQSAMLEIDRQKGMDAMKAAGIDVPEHQTFGSLDEAEAFARKSEACYVFKPLGSEDRKDLTYVSDSPADMVGWIKRQKSRGMKLKSGCLMQEKIDLRCEIGVSGWFGPEGFLPEKWSTCVEHKRLMPGEIGPNTGEMGSLLQYVEKDKLAEQMLVPMEPILRTLGHRGDFAIGACIDSKGKAWPLEFTARAGWPAWFIQTASHRGDVAKWMYDLFDGEDTLRVDYRPAIGVVLAQPPFPQFNGKPEDVEGNPICGFDDVWDQVHVAMTMIDRGCFMDGDSLKEGACYQTAGELVAVVTGLGSTVSNAMERAYEAVEQIKYSDKMYRNDIGQKLEKALPFLHRHGWLPEMSWD